MQTIVKGVKAKNKVIIGKDNLNMANIGIYNNSKGIPLGIMELTTTKRLHKNRPSILAVEFNTVEHINTVIDALKALRKKMIKKGVPASNGLVKGPTQSIMDIIREISPDDDEFMILKRIKDLNGEIKKQSLVQPEMTAFSKGGREGLTPEERKIVEDWEKEIGKPIVVHDLDKQPL